MENKTNQKWWIKLNNTLNENASILTTHGVYYIYKSNLHWIERFFWFVSFSIAVVSIILLSTPIVNRYKSSPTVLSVEMDYFNWNISFPAITLCTDIKVDPLLLDEFVNRYNVEDKHNLSRFIESVSSVKIDNIGEIVNTDHELVPPEEYSIIAATVYRKPTNFQLNSNTNQPVMRHSIMTEMGMCDVVNSNVANFDMPENWKSKKLTYTRDSIQINAHDGLFFIQTFHYTDVTMYIHSPDDVLQSSALGYRHDDSTFLSVYLLPRSTKSSSDVKRLKPSQRNCRHIDEPISTRDDIYTYNRCLKECRIRIAIILCGCVPHFYRPIGGEKICSMSELSCFKQYKNTFKYFTTSFDKVVMPHHTDGLPRSVRDCRCLQNCEEDIYIENNVVLSNSKVNMLRVGIESYPKVRYTREIIFGFYDVLVGVGGVSNLCLGMSAISVAEIVIFIIITPLVSFIKRFVYNNSN